MSPNLLALANATGSETAVLLDLVKLFAMALVVTALFDRLRIPTIVGLLLTGVLCGPDALGIVSDSASVQAISQVGIILLLFTVGLEFSFDAVKRIRIPFLVGGTLQHLLTGAPVMGLAMLVGFSWQIALFLAIVAIQSSTAVGIKMLQERAEGDSPQGRLAVAMSLFQDLLSVAFVLVLPLLAVREVTSVSEPHTAANWSVIAGKVVGLGVFLWFSARYAVPWILFRVAAMRDREVFLLSVIVIGFGIAAITSWAGLSIALGAFLAGIIISESEYGHRALGSILPFKEVFISLFFISVGMLLDPKILLEQPLLVAGLMASIMSIKFVTIGAVVLLLKYPLRVAFHTAMLMAAIGEFGFVLAGAGLEAGVIKEDLFQLFLATSIVSLMVSPLLIAAAPAISDKLGLQKADSTRFGQSESAALAECGLSDHLIIVGFGPVGRYSARAAAAAGIPYLIIEMNPHTVRTERAQGEPIYYGDASQGVVLSAAGLERARVILVVIADPAGSRQIVQAARTLSPTVKIVARTRFQSEIQPLLDIGADEVIPEELETAIELLSRVLKTYLVPIEQVDMLTRQARARGYQLLREKGLETHRIHGLESYLSDIDVSVIRVKDRPAMIGQSLATLALRTRHGVTVVALRRGGETILNPDPLEPLEEGDELVAVGQPQQLSTIARKLQGDDLIPVVGSSSPG